VIFCAANKEEFFLMLKFMLNENFAMKKFNFKAAKKKGNCVEKLIRKSHKNEKAR
jgi:hypothetical protein